MKRAQAVAPADSLIVDRTADAWLAGRRDVTDEVLRAPTGPKSLVTIGAPG